MSDGFGFTCGLVSGAAYCWGDNTYGQLGNGTTAGSTSPVAVSGGLTFVPAAVSGGITFTALTAGSDHICAIRTGGAVYCWGYGNDNELGTSSITNSLTPARVSNP